MGDKIFGDAKQEEPGEIRGHTSFKGCSPAWGREINKTMILVLKDKRVGIRQLLNFLSCDS